MQAGKDFHKMGILGRLFAGFSEGPCVPRVIAGLTEILEATRNPPEASRLAASAMVLRDRENPNDAVITLVTHVFAKAPGVAADDLAQLQESTALQLGGRHLLQVGSASLRHVEVVRDGATVLGMVYLLHRPSLYIVAWTSPEEIHKGISLKGGERRIQPLVSAITKQEPTPPKTPPHLIELDQHIGGYSVKSGRAVFEEFKKDLDLSDVYSFLIRPLQGQAREPEFHFNVTCGTCEKPYEFSVELRGSSKYFVKCPECRSDRWVFQTRTLARGANATWLVSIDAFMSEYLAKTRAHITDVRPLR